LTNCTFNWTCVVQERGGSSRQAILKYIIKHYNVGHDERIINAHLKLALRAGVKNGSLKQSKGTGASGSFRIGEKEKAVKKPKAAKKPKAKKPKAAGAKKTKKPKKAGEAKAKKPKVKKAKAVKKPAAAKAKKPKTAKPKKPKVAKKAAKKW